MIVFKISARKNKSVPQFAVLLHCSEGTSSFLRNQNIGHQYAIKNVLTVQKYHMNQNTWTMFKQVPAHSIIFS